MDSKVTILGIVHQDPLGRAKITSYLQALRNQGIVPDLFAVEWKEKMAADLISARHEFKKSLKNNIPDLYESTLEAITLTVAYEADASDEVFEGTQKLWLDEDREEEDFSVSNFLANRVFFYFGICYEIDSLERNNLERISTETWEQLNCGKWEPKKRDKIFADLVLQAIAKGFENIVAIVGASHARIENEGSFADILIKHGVKLDTKLLI